MAQNNLRDNLTLPALYSQEDTTNPIVYAKFFTPDSNWTWLATEGQPEGDDFMCFGYVIGFEEEWGYFSLNEMQEARGPMGLGIERDIHFTARPFSEVVTGRSAE